MCYTQLLFLKTAPLNYYLLVAKTCFRIGRETTYKMGVDSFFSPRANKSLDTISTGLEESLFVGVCVCPEVCLDLLLCDFMQLREVLLNVH